MAKKKLPKEFRLNNYNWSIKELSQEEIDLDMRYSGAFGTYCGYSKFNNLTIGIRKDLDTQHKPRTVLHEVIHSCLRNLPKSFDKDVEEELVLHLTDQLTDLIKNNPKLIEYFKENL